MSSVDLILIDDGSKREFKGIFIPAEIWEREDLLIIHKALWAEIKALERREVGWCWASNGYLAKFLGVSSSRVADLLTDLRKLGLLEDGGFNGVHRYIRTKTPTYEESTPFLPTGNPLPVYRNSPSCLQEPEYGSEGSSEIRRKKIPKKEIGGGVKQAHKRTNPDQLNFQSPLNETPSSPNSAPPPSSSIAQQLVVDQWNSHPELPRVHKLTPQRSRILAARLKEPFFRDNWKVAIQKVVESDFATGRALGAGKREWHLDFDFFISDSGFTRIMEDKYKNRGGIYRTSSPDYDPTAINGPSRPGRVA